MKIKPFTCFLFAVALILIALSPWLIQSYYTEQPETETYEGILTLWNITGWRTGGSSSLSFLKKRVQEFESRNAHVFIDVVALTPEEAKEAVQSGQTPDIISYPLGFDPGIQLSPLPHIETIFTQMPDSAYPYICGAYCIMVNTDMLDKEGVLAPAGWGVRPDELIAAAQLGVCFDSESGYSALPAVAVHEYPPDEGPGGFTWEAPVLPEAALELPVSAYSDGLRVFRTEQACVLVASHRQLFELIELLEDSSAPSFRSYALGAYTDMVQLVSVASCENEIKLQTCADFSQFLLSEEVQKKVEALGVFPVLPGLDVYKDNECLFMMYELLSKGALNAPPKDAQKLGELSMRALGGSKDALEDIRNILGFD